MLEKASLWLRVTPNPTITGALTICSQATGQKYFSEASAGALTPAFTKGAYLPQHYYV